MAAPRDPSSKSRSIEETVGDAVRQYRTDQNLTLAQFAAITGVSGGMISKIEHGQVSASLSTLEALARGMGIPVANLFAATIERKEVSFVKSGAGILTRRSGSTYDHQYQLVGRASDATNTVECYVITIPRHSSGQPLMMMRGVEFIHMMEGEMSYRIGDDLYDLEPGDSLTFDGEMPHGPQNVSSEFAQFLTVTSI